MRVVQCFIKLLKNSRYFRLGLTKNKTPVHSLILPLNPQSGLFKQRRMELRLEISILYQIKGR